MSARIIAVISEAKTARYLGLGMKIVENDAQRKFVLTRSIFRKFNRDCTGQAVTTY